MASDITLRWRALPVFQALLLLLAGLPANAAVSPAPRSNRPTGLDGFEVHPDFALERVAAEPVIQDPVDLQFDEHGVAYVVEMGGYPFSSDDPAQYPGKVVIIEDTDNDGMYDRRIVFADKFQYADSILPHRGGILVAAPPDILYLKDTDGDGRADVREVWLSGFSVGNSQHNVNGLLHGLDNWIYAGNGGNSGSLFWPGRPDERLPVRQRDIRFDFEGKRVEFFGPTTTGFNVAMDDWGRIFTTHNLRHINHLVFPLRYVERNPHLPPRGNPDISDHKTGGLDRGYPIGAQESRLNHPEQSGYFSCACGITCYNGGAFPDEFNGAIFVADAVLNIVHHDRLYAHGPSFLAARDRDKVEFLATTNRHSRPVNMRVGPDGALYLVDMYRAVIEHPEWIPDELEKDMDLYAGSQQGRIYRITPRAGLPRVLPRFDRNNPKAVIRALDHRNRWWRDTAQRLLVWWDAPTFVPELESLFDSASLPQARLHVLWTLRGLSSTPGAAPGLGALREELLLRALRDPHPGVRENALVIAETGLEDVPARVAAAIELVNDPDPRVRMQAALTLGELRNSRVPGTTDAMQKALLSLARRDLGHDWTRFAILTCLGRDPLPLFLGLLRDSTTADNADRDRFLAELAELIGAQRQGEAIASAFEALAAPVPADATVLAVVDGLNTGLAKGGQELHIPRRQQIQQTVQRLQQNAPTSLVAALWTLQRHLGLDIESDRAPLLADARTAVLDARQTTAQRLASLRLLAYSEFEFREETLWQLLGFQHPQELQSAALRQLTGQRTSAITEALIDRWSTLSRACRDQASDYFIYNAANHDALLTALETGRLPMGQLNLDLERRRRFLWSDNPAVRQRAEALFTDAGVVTRAEVLTRLKPALQLTGDPVKGRAQYQNLCAQCHTMGTEGSAVGPDLTEIHRKGPETLLSDLFDPNAAVNTEYLGYTIDNQDGDVFAGIVRLETDALVTLRQAGGQDVVIPRSRMATMSSSGLSLMPEGLEAGLSLQDVADLLSFLQLPR
jgi:putative membrane-bound dehydrogenase-like protein